MSKRKLQSYDARVRPIVKEMQRKRGFAAEIVRQMGRLLKRPIKRQQVTDQWLAADPTKRIEPSYSTAMKLFEAVDKARTKLCNKCVVCQTCGHTVLAIKCSPNRTPKMDSERCI